MNYDLLLTFPDKLPKENPAATSRRANEINIKAHGSSSLVRRAIAPKTIKIRAAATNTATPDPLTSTNQPPPFYFYMFLLLVISTILTGVFLFIYPLEEFFYLFMGIAIGLGCHFVWLMRIHEKGYRIREVCT